MKRKNQNKYYCVRVVTLIIAFVNIYKVFRPITLLKHILITNKFVAENSCLLNSVINTLTTLVCWIFILPVLKA